MDKRVKAIEMMVERSERLSKIKTNNNKQKNKGGQNHVSSKKKQ